MSFRSKSSRSSPSDKPSSPPPPGTKVLCDFICRSEPVRALCVVEEQGGPVLWLRVVAEMGKIPLIGLRPGTSGQLELGTDLVPIKIIHVDLPRVQIELTLGRGRPSQRESLRTRANFSVLFRPQGQHGPWIPACGVDISAEGVCILASSPSPFCLRSVYELDITLKFPLEDDDPKIVGLAEVRWIKESFGKVNVGLRLCNSTARRHLARAAHQLQHQIYRHPEDYLCSD